MGIGGRVIEPLVSLLDSRAGCPAGPYFLLPLGVRLTLETAAASIAAALDDARRCTISDPRRGNYHVSFHADSIDDAEEIQSKLAQIGVTGQINARTDSHGNGRVRVAIYKLADLERLHRAVGADVSEERREKLSDLVRARGPIPPELVARMISTIDSDETHEYVARRLNELGEIDGMGGKEWTANKVRRAIANSRSPR